MLAVGLARADSPVLHAAVSAGFEWLPSAHFDSGAGSTVRLELGAGPKLVQGYAVFDGALHNAVDADTQSQTGAIQVAGDFYALRVGGGARFPLEVGRFAFVPHANGGLAIIACPVKMATFTDYYGAQPALGRSTMTYWGTAGGDVGVFLDEDHMAGVTVGGDGGLTGQLGVTAEARFGFFARL